MKNLKSMGYVCSLLLWALLGAAQAADPDETVRAFNAAIPEGDADKIASLLADGGVQFTIRSPHEGFTPEKLTTSIVPYWKMIAPVIATSTEVYERDVEIVDSRTMGNIATVWAQIATRRQLKGQDEVKVDTYHHVYLLIATPDGWKIVGIADNRESDSVAG